MCPPPIPPFYTPGDLGDFSQFSSQAHTLQFLTQAGHRDLWGQSSRRAPAPPPHSSRTQLPTAHAACVLMCDVGLCTGTLLTKMPSCPPLTSPTPLPRHGQVPPPPRAFPPPLAPCAPPVAQAGSAARGVYQPVYDGVTHVAMLVPLRSRDTNHRLPL